MVANNQSVVSICTVQHLVSKRGCLDEKHLVEIAAWNTITAEMHVAVRQRMER